MDKVQIYVLVMLAINALCSMYMHGETYTSDFRLTFFGYCLALPWIGRVFGWW
jgi:hypothetical protein